MFEDWFAVQNLVSFQGKCLEAVSILIVVEDIERFYGAAHHVLNIFTENIEKQNSKVSPQPIIARSG